MITLRKGIAAKKKVEPPLPKYFIGSKVKCDNCKAEFKLEAKDDWWSTGYHHDTIFVVDCAHCGKSIYIGDDR